MGSKGSNSTSSVTIPPQVLAQYNNVNAIANKAAATPYQAYSGELVAPVNAQEQTGIAGTNAAANSYQPYYNAATAATVAGGQAVNPTGLDTSAINKYMSPYLNDVVGSESALLNQNNQQQQSGQLGTAISSGAFGGDRSGIAAANLSQQQNLANANIYSNLLNTGYNTALGTAQQQQGVQLSADQANRAALQQTGASLAGLGTAAQTAGLTGAAAQTSAGQLQQQTQQAADTASMNQYLQGQSYPFQTAQFLANIAEGTGSLSGSTTSTNSTQNGIFSDKRLKEDTRKVGETFDGQPIYTYKYKGHPETHMGLMAQDVEKHDADAVGLASGYKTVDYRKATDKAAERGHFAGGGLATDPWQSILGNYQQMYGGLTNAKSGLDAGTIIPASTSQPHQLMTAQTPAAAPQPGVLQQAASLASDADSIGKFGDKAGAWSYGKDKGLGTLDDSDANDGLGDQYARGGLAAGGDPSDMPYSGQGLAIPDDTQKYTLPAAKPAGGGSGESPLGDLKDIASIAGTIASFASGGRARRADGGETDEYAGLDGDISSLQAALHAAYQAQAKRAVSIAPAADDDDNDDDNAMRADPTPLVARGLGTPVANPEAMPNPAKGGKLDPEVVSYFTDHGVPPEIAKGIAGGVYAESGNNPDAVNPTSGALGLGQHLGPRKAALINMYGEHPTKMQQLAFILSEIRGGDKGMASVLKSPDADSALSAYIKNGMRPAAGPETTGDISRGLGAIRHGFASGGSTDYDPSDYDPDPASDSDYDQGAGAGLGTVSKIPLPPSRDADKSGLAASILPDNFSAAVNDNVAPQEPQRRQATGLAAYNDMLDPQGAVQYGASTPNYFGSGQSYLDGSLKDNVKHGKTDIILPILKGLAAFGTANTSNPLTAIATGLGAGADAYQGQRDFEAKRTQMAQELALRNRTVGLTGYQAGLEGAALPYNNALTAAQTGQVGAQTARTQALVPAEVQSERARAALTQAQALGVPATYHDITNIPDGKGGTTMWVVNRADPTKSYFMTPGGSLAPGDAAGAVATTPSPTPPMATPSHGASAQSGTPVPQQQNQQPAKSGPWKPTLAADNVTIPRALYLQGGEPLAHERTNAAATVKGLEDSASQADVTQGQLAKLSEQYANLPASGFGAPGYGGNTRNQILKEINAGLGVFGAAPIADTAPGESLAKLTNTLGFAMSRSLGAHEAGDITRTAISSNPGIENTPMALRRLTSSMYEELQRQKDKAAFFNDWIQRSGGTTMGAREAFDQLNPSTKYATRALMRTVDARHAALLRKDPSSYRADFDKTYGSGMSNYFVGKPQ